MSTAGGDDRLFDVAPSLAELEDRLSAHRQQEDALRAELRICEERLSRLTALLHAIREFAGDGQAAATAARLAEGGWSGTGRQLVATTRAVLLSNGDRSALQPG